MANLASINNTIRLSITRQISPILSAVIIERKDRPDITLAEGFPIYVLNLSTSNAREFDLTNINYTGFWHFQIHYNNKPTAFAKVRNLIDLENNWESSSALHWEISSFFESTICEKIDDSLHFLDEKDIEGEVSLLEIPSIKLTALSIKSSNNGYPDKFCIIDVMGRDNEPYVSSLLDSEAFLNMINDYPIVIGRKISANENK